MTNEDWMKYNLEKKKVEVMERLIESIDYLARTIKEKYFYLYKD